jgi:hypothetical protein
MIGHQHDFFRWIVDDMIDSLMKTDEERVDEAYTNPSDDFSGTAGLTQVLKVTPAISINKIMKQAGLRMHANALCAQIVHVPVLQQFRGGLCGFHMYYNAKCLLRAILADKKFEQLVEVLNMESARNFWRHYDHCL